MKRGREPARAAAALESRRLFSGCAGESYAGYAVVGLRFARGDVLSVHRATSSSIGPPFAGIALTTPEGRTQLRSNVDASRSFARYCDGGDIELAADDIEFRWTGARELAVSGRARRLRLGLRLAPSPATTALSALWRLIPRPAWRRSGFAAAVGRLSAGMLDAPGLILSGMTASGHAFIVRPSVAWIVEAAAAVLDGRDLGPLAGGARPPTGSHAALPWRPLLIAGSVSLQRGG